MTTLTEEQRQDFLRQINEAQERLDAIKAARSGSSSVNSDIPDGLNQAQIGGSSGIGFESDENQAAIADQVESTILSGGSKSQTGDFVSSSQAEAIGRSFGLEGLVDPSAFAGLTRGEAASRARAERQRRTGQVSANTTFTFNPETLRRTQREIDKFGFALDEIGNDPLEPEEFKDEERQSTIDITARELGKLFNSPDELYDAANFNEPMKNALQQFVEKGGSIDSIAKNITAPSGIAGNEDPAAFLANINNPTVNKEAEELAIDELMPESEVAQNEIARIGRIPEDLKELYFGNEKQIGIYQMRQNQAKEEIRIIEDKERDAKATARERADLAIDKNRAESKRIKNEVEENRMRAKNFMTARLAKLGALKTTGAAPLAIKTIDAKYDQSIAEIEQNYSFANRQLEINLTEDLNNIENLADETIFKIQEDLTLGAEKMGKEVLKEQQKADKEIYKITEQYARRLRQRTSKYTADLKKEAEKYAKAYAATVSESNDAVALLNGNQEGDFVPGKGVLLPNGTFSDLRLSANQTREVQSANLAGDSTIRYFLSLPSDFRNELIRQSLSGGRTFNTADELATAFNEWEAEQEAEDDEFEGF